MDGDTVRINEKVTKQTWLCLYVVIIMGGFLRFLNLNWDHGFMYNPDEMNILMAVSRISFFDQMDPGFYAYNGFPIHLYKIIGSLIAYVWQDPNWSHELAKLALVSRYTSASLSLCSIYLMFLIGRRLFGNTGGILTAFFMATSVGLIQAAHYGTTETLLVFFLCGMILESLRLLQKREVLFRDGVMTAIYLGLAVGTKTTALSFLLIPIITVIILLRYKKLTFRKATWVSFGVLFIATGIFVTVSPFTLIHFGIFLKTMVYESGVTSGQIQVPYTVQFQQTVPYVYQLRNLPWMTSLGVAWGGMIGSVIWFREQIKKWQQVSLGEIPTLLPLMVFSLVYFAYIGQWYAKFIRYLVLMIPFLCLSMVYLIEKVPNGLTFRCIHRLMGSLIVIFSMVWALAFASIYMNLNTRTQAKQWIYQNIAPGQVLIGEHYDYLLPGPYTGMSSQQYQHRVLHNFDPDSEAKKILIAETLAEGDYLILSSRRLWGTISRVPELYPMTSRYYELLFSGELGYSIVKEFSSYPRLGRFIIHDDVAEETFQVFDHPVVYIFVNKKGLTRGDLAAILSATD